MPKPKTNWTLKRLLKKAADVDLNTALAISKSLLEEDKRKNFRDKELADIPFNLMLEPHNVKAILDLRLSEEILQSLQFKEFYPKCDKVCKNWDKSSLNNDLMPGDISYDNINLSEKMDFYVEALIPPLSPSKFRVGDKIFNMSQIPGREKTIMSVDVLDIKINNTSHINGLAKVFILGPENEKNASICTTDNNSVGVKEAVQCNLDNTNLQIRINNLDNNGRFVTMFNNCRYSDLSILLKSGNTLHLHKFVLAAWQCSENDIKENHYSVISIDDEIVIKLFKHLYSDGKCSIDDIINEDNCIFLCKKFGIDHKLLQKSNVLLQTQPLAHELSPIIISDNSYTEFNSNNEICHSTPYPIKGNDPRSFSENYLTPTSGILNYSSDYDLFQSCTKSSSIEITEDNVEPIIEDTFKQCANNLETLHSSFPFSEEIENYNEANVIVKHHQNKNNFVDEENQNISTLSNILKDLFDSSQQTVGNCSVAITNSSFHNPTTIVQSDDNTNINIMKNIDLHYLPSLLTQSETPLEEVVLINLCSDEDDEIRKNVTDNNSESISNRKHKRKLPEISNLEHEIISKRKKNVVETNEKSNVNGFRNKFSKNISSNGVTNDELRNNKEKLTFEQDLSKDICSNEQLYTFLKANYFAEILTYQSLDTTKIMKQFKKLNLKYDLRTLVDYFDRQCISYFRSKEPDNKRKPMNRKKQEDIQDL